MSPPRHGRAAKNLVFLTLFLKKKRPKASSRAGAWSRPLLDRHSEQRMNPLRLYRPVGKRTPTARRLPPPSLAPFPASPFIQNTTCQRGARVCSCPAGGGCFPMRGCRYRRASLACACPARWAYLSGPGSLPLGYPRQPTGGHDRFAFVWTADAPPVGRPCRDRRECGPPSRSRCARST